jgi:NADPH:quinone reductase-like Zn-dependent oxidoreductase
MLLLVVLLQFVYDGVGKSTFDSSLKCLDYLGWLISFGNASGKPEPFDVLRCATAAVAAASRLDNASERQCRPPQQVQCTHHTAVLAIRYHIRITAHVNMSINCWELH